MNRRCLLIGWSGADWELAQPLIDAGKMPNLCRLVAGGASAESRGFAPYSSPMAWATIATGQHPDDHGVMGYATTDEFRAKLAETGTRRTKALWELLSEGGKRVAVVGWPCSLPVETVRGHFVSDAFGLASLAPSPGWVAGEHCVHPPALAAALNEVRLRASDVDTGLLGLFVPELRLKGLQDDPHLRFLKGRLAELYSLHNAAVLLLARGEAEFAALHFSFLRQIGDRFLLYCPPRHPRVNRRDQARYGEVVEAAYRLQDALLGDLLKSAGPDCTVLVCSDHGFLTGGRLPGPTLPLPDSNPANGTGYRPQGIFVAHGPPIAHHRLGAVRLDDIAPTVLACLGEPPASGMRGQAIGNLFETSGESGPPPAAAAAKRGLMSPISASEEDRRCVEEILIERHLLPAHFKTSAGKPWVERQNEIMLGTALLALGRPLDALPHLQSAILEEPESLVAAQPLVHALLDLRMVESAERAAQPIFDYGPGRSGVTQLRARFLMARGRYAEALKSLDHAPPAPVSLAEREAHREVQLLILAQSSRQREAVSIFQSEIKEHPKHALLYLGLGNAFIRSGSHGEAIGALEKALELDNRLDLAKHLLAQARRLMAGGGRPVAPSWDDLGENVRQALAHEREYRRREEGIVAHRQQRRAQEPGGGASTKQEGSVESAWTVRPPWPDEESRLRKYFKVNLSSAASGRLWKWVIEARNPERIVGVATLRDAEFQDLSVPHLNDGLLLDWEIRDGWLDRPAAEALLRTPIEQVERTAGKPLLTRVSNLAMKDLAQRLGFETVRRREIGVMSMQHQLAQIQARFGEKLKAQPIEIHPIGRANPATVSRICQHHHLQDPRLIRPMTPGSSAGFEPDLSFFAGSPDRPAIILLAREHLGEVYLEILARNPDVPDFPRLGIMALLARFAEALAGKGLNETFYQVTAGASAGLAPIVHRVNGRATQFWEVLLWKGPPG